MILVNELTKSTIEINSEQKDLVIGTITPLFQYDAEHMQRLYDLGFVMDGSATLADHWTHLQTLTAGQKREVLTFTVDKAIQNTVIFDWVPNTNMAMKNIIAYLTDAQVLQACNDVLFDGVMTV